MARISTAAGLLMIPYSRPKVVSEKDIILDRHYRALRDKKKK